MRSGRRGCARATAWPRCCSTRFLLLDADLDSLIAPLGLTDLTVIRVDRSDTDVERRAKLFARQGQAYPSADLVRVVDPEMRDIPQDGEAMGEVVMRGNNVMSGYFADEAATAKAFRGGWYIIISGGENISSIEVEQTTCAHPAVLECAVIGIPHERWGERPKAFVTLNGEARATAEEIVAFCRQRLAHYKCPDAIEFVPLPKTSTGKVQKFALREREWRGHETRVGAT